MGPPLMEDVPNHLVSQGSRLLLRDDLWFEPVLNGFKSVLVSLFSLFYVISVVICK